MATQQMVNGDRRGGAGDSANSDHLFPDSFTPLCFDRSEFGRSDFNVDAFLAKARRRGATLEKIRDDARVYLKIIQNSMIELINQDYADFVHLSSNLAGLRSSLEKLGVETQQLTGDFDETAVQIGRALSSLTTEIDEKRRLAEEQQLIETQISALTLLEQLQKLFSASNSSEIDIRRTSYLFDELKIASRRMSSAKFQTSFASVVDHFQKILEHQLITAVKGDDSVKTAVVLHGFQACELIDSAKVAFLTEFVEPCLRTCFQQQSQQRSQQQSTKEKRMPISNAAEQKLQQLERVLSSLLELRRKHLPAFSAADRTICVVEPKSFLDDCLLTSLLSCLEDRFSWVLVPTDAAAFRSAYYSVMDFAKRWTTSRTGEQRPNRLLKMIFDKFSLRIYYQLRYQEITSDLETRLPSEFRLDSETTKFRICSTKFAYQSMVNVWSDDEQPQRCLYLPPLFSKCVEITFMILNHYGNYIVNADFGQNEPDENMTFLVSIVADIRALQTLMHTQLQNEIRRKVGDEQLSKLERLEICLRETCHRWRLQIETSISEAIRGWLVKTSSAQLAAVGEVPRQYRWTRKEAPTQPSAYLAAAFDPFRKFLDVSRSLLPDDSVYPTKIIEQALVEVTPSFSENLKSVIESVEKISSSLSRLKTKGNLGLATKSPSVPDNMNNATDDQKIRLQLRLDVQELEKSISDFGLHVNCDLSVMKQMVADSGGLTHEQ